MTITNVPPTIADPHLRMFLQQMKNVLDNGTGADGTSLKDQLVDNGLATVAADGTFSFNPAALGDVSVTNPMVDLSAPSAPSAFTTTGTENYIILAWEGIEQSIVSGTHIYVSPDSNFANAIMVGTATGKVFGYAPDLVGTTYYFWVRFISYAGTPSALNSLTGTTGVTDAGNPDDITVNTVTAAKAIIGEGEISNLYIGDTIQSDNYVPGVSGWAIKK